ncbi:MAG: T9SS type A sorting domain-containing protein [Bacteroidota bacterium]
MQVLFLHAQVLSFEITKDTSTIYRSIYNGIEVPGKGFVFIGNASKNILPLTASNYLFLFFSTDYNGNVLAKKTYSVNIVSVNSYVEYRYYNIHYTRAGFVLTGLLCKHDTINRTDSMYLCSMKLDDNLNLVTTNYQFIDSIGGTASLYAGAYIKSRLFNNKILLTYTDIFNKHSSIYALVDTSGKFLFINRDTESFSFDIAEDGNNFIVAQGLSANRSFNFLNDSLMITGRSAIWAFPGFPYSPGYVFNHSGLDFNNGNTCLKRLSSSSLIHGGDCDSIGDPNAPGQLFMKTMYTLIKTDNAGTILLKKGWHDIFLDQGVINTFDFVNPNNIFISVKAGGSFLIINVDSNFNERWRKIVTTPYPYYVSFSHSMFATIDGGCVITGIVRNFNDTGINQMSDIFIFKINSDGNMSDVPKEYNSFHDLFIYPNPSSDKIFISGETQNRNFVLYNLQGNEVLTAKDKELINGISVTSLKTGLYFYKLTDKLTGAVKTGKWVKGE